MFEHLRFRTGRLIRSLGLCIVFFTSNIAFSQELSEAEAIADKQWMEDYLVYLQSSEHAQLRISAAVSLLQGNDPDSIERATEIIEEVLSAPDPDVMSLWLLASNCQFSPPKPWCGSDGVYKTLLRTEADNAAVLLMPLSPMNFASPETSLDTPENRQLLLRAAKTDRYDGYWGRGADKIFAQALAYIKTNPYPPVPDETPIEMTPQLYAFMTGMTPLIMSPTPGYSSLIDLCRAQFKHQRAETMNACKNLASLLRKKARTHLARNIGYAMERVMIEAIDPSDPRIESWRLRGRVNGRVQMCLAPHWLKVGVQTGLSEEVYLAWAKDLDELGEWEASKRAAIKEYQASPDDFDVNPANCEKLLDLNDADMIRLVNDEVTVAELLGK